MPKKIIILLLCYIDHIALSLTSKWDWSMTRESQWKICKTCFKQSFYATEHLTILSPVLFMSRDTSWVHSHLLIIFFFHINLVGMTNKLHLTEWTWPLLPKPCKIWKAEITVESDEICRSYGLERLHFQLSLFVFLVKKFFPNLTWRCSWLCTRIYYLS